MAIYPIQDTQAPTGQQAARLTCRQLIASDLRAWAKIWFPNKPLSEPIGFLNSAKLIWNYCGLRATLLYRISHALNQKRIPVLPGVVTRLNIVLYGFDVPSSVPIGPGMYIPHPVGTVITAKRVGANVSIISGITIGMRNVPGFPTVGDNVFIGAGARILGAITIGDNANIGANAVVLKDVPAGATAVGVPARLLPLKTGDA